MVYYFFLSTIYIYLPHFSLHEQKSSVEKIEEDLARARAAIRRAIRSKNYTSYKEDERFIPSGSMYRNSYAFHQLSFVYFVQF